MNIPFKDVFGLGKELLSGARRKKQAAERDRFEHGKQEFLMNFVTIARTRPGANGFRPTPGTIEFGYCESLTRDGVLKRDILTGVYILPVSAD